MCCFWKLGRKNGRHWLATVPNVDLSYLAEQNGLDDRGAGGYCWAPSPSLARCFRDVSSGASSSRRRVFVAGAVIEARMFLMMMSAFFILCSRVCEFRLAAYSVMSAADHLKGWLDREETVRLPRVPTLTGTISTSIRIVRRWKRTQDKIIKIKDHYILHMNNLPYLYMACLPTH